MTSSVTIDDPGQLRPLLGWVDSRFGPFHDLKRSRFAEPHPDWWRYHCRLSRSPADPWRHEPGLEASGLSLDPDEALVRCLGEAAERYSGMLAGGRWAAARIEPTRDELALSFPRCLDDEPCEPSFRGLHGLGPLTHFAMSRGDGSTVMVPAGFADHGFRPDESEPWAALPISTGLAFHTDWTMALWSGLCEAAERDAFMIAWLIRREACRDRPVRNTAAGPGGTRRPAGRRRACASAI